MAGTALTSWARRILVTTAVVAALAAASSAFAAPATSLNGTVTKTTAAFRAQLIEKQKQVDALNAALDNLENQAEIAQEAVNQASIELTQTTAKVAQSEADLANTRAALAIQDDILAKRAAAIYRDGSLSAFQILLDSKSLGDFIGRVKFLNTVGSSDANLASNLKGQKTLQEQQLLELQKAQSRAQELEFELRARDVELKLRIADEQKLLDAAQSDIRTMADAEAARRASEQQTLLQQVLSGANAAGIVVTPGSPVETALAYHGVPYIWGGATPSGFDCSGLVMYVFAQHGVTLPHYSGWQFLQGEKIPVDQIQPNDVVFFGSPVHHVGIYCGGGYFIEAPHRNDFVKISKLSGRNDIAGVRRYAWTTRTAAILGAQSSTDAALKTVR